MTTEETKERLVKVRKTLDHQANQIGFHGVLLTIEEAELLICLIDTVLRWDYEI